MSFIFDLVACGATRPKFTVSPSVDKFDDDTSLVVEIDPVATVAQVPQLMTRQDEGEVSQNSQLVVLEASPHFPKEDLDLGGLSSVSQSNIVQPKKKAETHLTVVGQDSNPINLPYNATIESLTIKNAYIDIGLIPRILQNLPCLKRLKFLYCHYSKDVLINIFRLAIQALTIRDELIPEEVYAAAFRTNRFLPKILVIASNAIRDEHVQKLLQCAQNLQGLTLASCPWLTAAALPPETISCPLEILRISCPNISAVTAELFAIKNPNIQVVSTAVRKLIESCMLDENPIRISSTITAIAEKRGKQFDAWVRALDPSLAAIPLASTHAALLQYAQKTYSLLQWRARIAQALYRATKEPRWLIASLRDLLDALKESLVPIKVVFPPSDEVAIPHWISMWGPKMQQVVVTKDKAMTITFASEEVPKRAPMKPLSWWQSLKTKIHV